MTSRPSPDFNRLWLAFGVSEVGSALATGALPFVAVTLLAASTFQVALLSAIAAISVALVGLRLGPLVEYRRKRPVMMSADLIRAVALLSVPLAVGLDVLTFPHLCLVGAVSALASTTFTAASTAHLKALVSAAERPHATARMEATTWSVQTVGAPLGGALIGLLGTTVTLLIDAISYLLSACFLTRIRRPEPAPIERVPELTGRADLVAGARYLRRPDLARMFGNSLIFGATMMGAHVVMIPFMLDDLGFAAWQYGLALGLPCLGGVLGAALAPRCQQRWGLSGVLLGFGILRCLWTIPLAFAPPGAAGVVVICVLDMALLVCAGIFNPTFATWRLGAIDDAILARVVTTWTVGTRLAMPIGMLGAGALASATSPRAAIVACGVLMLASLPLLPRPPVNLFHEKHADPSQNFTA